MESIIIKPHIDIAQVSSFNPLKNYSNISAMCLGRYDSCHIYRLLLQIPISLIPEDAIIIEANLKLCITATGKKQPNRVTPYALMSNWSVDTVTWNSQPSFSTSIYGDSVNIKNSGQYIFNITEVVKSWYNGEIINNGIILKNEETEDNTFSKVLASPYKSYSPQVTIKYVLKCKCECECTVIPTEFIQGEEELTTSDSYNFSLIRDTSLTKIVTFFITNIGTYAVTAKLQISPEGTIFVDDNGDVIIESGETKAIVPYIFGKFTRMAVKNINTAETSNVKVWYQAQQ